MTVGVISSIVCSDSQRRENVTLRESFEDIKEENE
jgi:hypothetical protein